jgi:hypothetical protein
MQFIRRFSIQIIGLVSIIIGFGLKYLPYKYQLIIGIPIFSILIVYSLISGESIYSKLLFILSAVLGLLYLIGISINVKMIQDIIVILCMLIMLSIFIIPKIHKYKLGIIKGVWTVLDISAIVILIIMMILFILAQIY